MAMQKGNATYIILNYLASCVSDVETPDLGRMDRRLAGVAA